MKLPNLIKNWNPIERYKERYNNSIVAPFREEIENLQKSSLVTPKNYLPQSHQSRENFDISPDLIQSYSFEDNYLSACVKKVVDKILAGGYVIKIKEDMANGDAQLAEFEEFEKVAGGNLGEHGEQINFLRVLRKVCLSLVKGDDVYIELELPQDLEGYPLIEEHPKTLHVLDWEFMVINKDAKGRLVELRIENGIRVDGAYKYVKGGMVLAIFSKYEIIHFNFYSEGTSSYGVSRIRSVMWAVSSKRFAEKYSSNTFLKQRPKLMIGINADDREYEKTIQQMKASELNPNSDVYYQISNKDDGQAPIKVDELTKPQDMAYKDFMESSKSDIPVGMGVPSGSIFGATSKSGWEAMTELHEFDEYINSLRDFIERILDNQLFERFEWDAIELVFNKANKRDERNEAATAQLLSNFMTLNEIRVKLGLDEIEGGDMITPARSSANVPNDAGSDSTQELTQSMAYLDSPIYNQEVSYKDTNTSFVKSYAHGGVMDLKKTRSKLSIKPPRGEQKAVTYNKTFQLENKYTHGLWELLKSFIFDVEDILKSKYTNFQKTDAKEAELAEIDKLIQEYLFKSQIISNSIINEAYNFGDNRASVETKIILSKSAVDIDTLNFLEKHNVDLIEGAFSEVSKRVKTQIRLGIQSQESVPQIIKRLKGVNSLEQTYKGRFENIARTEVSRAMTEGHINGYEKSGVVQKVEALIGNDPDGLCHKTLEGKTFTLEESRGLIPIHPRCSCSLLPIVE